eukprot:CAMPEP_0172483986 /NCGR_PEP_ID=MMETSP1066-20121228/11235_1 /TAXON_ID=671091 /ORGANISM="Coscinodiscus wailesii, Strain CCMP2513" /LENGTH=120 /DNA_ID=CAMNT_0013248211 /DNA_START=97 /DNA_END=455 /DNA_ORIENTATION=+
MTETTGVMASVRLITDVKSKRGDVEIILSKSQNVGENVATTKNNNASHFFVDEQLLIVVETITNGRSTLETTVGSNTAHPADDNSGKSSYKKKYDHPTMTEFATIYTLLRALKTALSTGA